MSAGLDVAFSKQVVSAAPRQSFNPIAMDRLEGRSVVFSPKQLLLHPTLQELGWTGVMNEFNDAARLKDQPVPVPILITTNGTILAGFGRWWSALFDNQQEINCIEYPLSEEEALRFIISHHHPQRGWNAYIRIRLALKLEPYFELPAPEGWHSVAFTHDPVHECNRDISTTIRHQRRLGKAARRAVSRFIAP